ncbi:hypothetical protein [Haloferula sargassicola]|uniref:Alpha-L-rhamnosidase six-hairpin glycosidase domain-containing protein n=1 Tax=Haloferula sargassicola TaxID=490096 RepID=A0ABP9USS8_9BACT
MFQFHRSRLVFLLVSLVEVATASAAELLFKDDFSAHGTSSTDLNLNLPPENGDPHPSDRVRQGGPLGTWRWTKTGGGNDSQIGNGSTDAGQEGAPSYPDYLLLAYSGAATLQLPLNESLAAGKPLTIRMRLGTALPPGYTDDSWWLAVRLGDAGSYYPVVGGAADFAFLYRINKAIQMFATGSAGVEYPAMGSADFALVLSDESGVGSAFSGYGSRISIYNGGRLVDTFQTEQLTEEYLNLSVQNAFASVDELAIERGVPEDLSPALRLVDAEIEPGDGTARLTWKSRPGASYRIYTSDTLGAWAPIGQEVEAADETASATVEFPGDPKRFFIVADAEMVFPLVFNGEAVVHDPEEKTVVMSDANGALMIRLNYAEGCALDRVQVNGRETLADGGVRTGIRAGGDLVTSRDLDALPTVAVTGDEVTVSGIRLDAGGVAAEETWSFRPEADRIVWEVQRNYESGGTIEDTLFPAWDFKNRYVWTAGLLDTGGVAWSRYIGAGTTYGAHASAVSFWRDDDAFLIESEPGSGAHAAARFSHLPSGSYSLVQSATPVPLAPKHFLRRYIQGTDLWAPFDQEAGRISTRLELRAVPERELRDRGDFQGVDGKVVGDVLDTMGRYGVIDRELTGGNGWLTGYICLHEPFFGMIALAMGSEDYTANVAASLDSWRRLAVQPDGRVLPRWKVDQGDNIVPGTYTADGFYEVGWGYLLDSQPDFVANVSEVFDLTGDLAWLAQQKVACEGALDWLLARDADDDGLVEMINGTHLDGKSSDWIDIVWAAGENAFVNAMLYHALVLWSEREEILGDPDRAAFYREKAARLRASFIKEIDDGGFWDPAKGWFAYWRNTTDGQVHGDNLVTPVNFAAVAYGLATPEQAEHALTAIEDRTSAEDLFHWPLCVEPFAADEGGGGAFPTYENGDIFLSWGELGIRSFARTRPEIALKYVRRLLDQYRNDGLSHQRYARVSQAGLGDDILAGNCLTIVGLYRDLLGVRPQWNRLMLDPHLPPGLEGSVLRYRLRGIDYRLSLGTVESTVEGDGFSATAATPFAVSPGAGDVKWYAGTGGAVSLAIGRTSGETVGLRVTEWPREGDGERRWEVDHSRPGGAVEQTLHGLVPGRAYQLEIDGAAGADHLADDQGEIHVVVPTGKHELRLVPAGS